VDGFYIADGINALGYDTARERSFYYSAHWPIILDLLDAAGVTWKIYNLGGVDDVPSGDSDNVAVFWSRWARDPRTTALQADYVSDCQNGTLPHVSWLIPSYTNGLDDRLPTSPWGWASNRR
jgi:phospholipase C